MLEPFKLHRTCFIAALKLMSCQRTNPKTLLQCEACVQARVASPAQHADALPSHALQQLLLVRGVLGEGLLWSSVALQSLL